jgi:hypothetical protein
VWVKILVAITSGAVMYSYLFFTGRKHNRENKPEEVSVLRLEQA